MTLPQMVHDSSVQRWPNFCCDGPCLFLMAQIQTYAIFSYLL